MRFFPQVFGNNMITGGARGLMIGCGLSLVKNAIEYLSGQPMQTYRVLITLTGILGGIIGQVNFVDNPERGQHEVDQILLERMMRNV